jgi:hypothetical protein
MNGNETNEKDRKEPAYPYYDLEASLKFAATIKELGGSRATVKKSLLAKQIGLAESTPSFFQRLSAAKTFGIIQGWGTYGFTELGRSYFYPQSEKARKTAILAMFSTPSSFKFLLDRFDGEKIPATDFIGNLLHSELNISESWKDRVVQAFNRSAHFAGIIDANGFFEI